MGTILVPWWHALLGLGIGLVYGGFAARCLYRPALGRAAAHVAEADELVDDLAGLLSYTLKAAGEDEASILRRRTIRDWATGHHEGAR